MPKALKLCSGCFLVSFFFVIVFLLCCCDETRPSRPYRG
jgi:hypothetical protein